MNEPKRKKRVVSGIRPTGPLHIGHLHGVIEPWRDMQDDYDCYFFIADYHALTNWSENMDVKKNAMEVALDMLASGLDPEKSTIFRQSDIVEIPQFHLVLSMFSPVGWLLRNPTYKDQVEQLKIESPNYGFLGYPVLQSADVLMYEGELVPIGKDQAAHLNLTIDLAETMTTKFGKLFPVPEYLHSEFATVPGSDNRKMSKSYGNVINIKDSEKQTTKVIKSYYTDPLKPYMGDPGHPNDCPVFYLDKIYVKDKDELGRIRKTCESGERGCGQCKAELAEACNNYLRPIRERRAELEQNPEKVLKVLADGAEKARKIAEKVLARTLKAVTIR
ncbi:MAG: tryptophan--tRNA ligase [bacterium]|nr:tryptophan--tRNA ligase [bacterium]